MSEMETKVLHPRKCEQQGLGTGHKVRRGGLGKGGGRSLFLSTVEGVGYGKLSAIIRVGHVKICRNVFKRVLMGYIVSRDSLNFGYRQS